MGDWTSEGNAGTHEAECVGEFGYVGSGPDPGTLTREVSVGSGVYKVTFRAAQYVGYVPGVSEPNSFDLRIDGYYKGTFTPSSSEFEEMSSGSIGLVTGEHAISFVDVSGAPNLYCYIDSLGLHLGGPLG